jgi:DNA-binding NtrC family response regulator
MKTEPIRILLVDDDPDTVGWMDVLLKGRGYEVRPAWSGADARQQRHEWHPDLILLDLKLPDADGSDLLASFRDEDPNVQVIMITGHGTVARAVAAMAAGAFSFIEKPVDPNVLIAVIEKALERRRLADENHRLRERLKGRTKFGDLIGYGEKMQELFRLASVVAPTDANVLVHGESGTGKELLASAIHEHSRRAGRPFVKINCAAVPHDLIESELFGYKKGAFTGAVADKVGLVQIAEGGSLLLDEIGEITPNVQVKLLRLLQEREFTPVGGRTVTPANFRLITATNTSLEAASRKLREDLYYRINTITLEIPPLRERPEDLLPLCETFVSKFAAEHGRDVQGISAAARSLLERHTWPGNVRELEHTIERAVIVATGPEILPADLPEILHSQGKAQQAPSPAASPLTLAEIERDAILQTLQRTNGNKREAASILGIYRPTLYGKLRKHKLAEYEPKGSGGDDARTPTRSRRRA